MLPFKLHARDFSRMIKVLFAVQVIVGGFCLLTAEAHAMPQSVWTQGVHAHCAKSIHAGGQHHGDQHARNHSDNCYHCDRLDQLAHVVFLSVAPLALALSDIDGLSVVRLSGSNATGLFTRRTTTGPPRSSSLLYTVTQRIRV